MVIITAFNGSLLICKRNDHHGQQRLNLEMTIMSNLLFFCLFCQLIIINSSLSLEVQDARNHINLLTICKGRNIKVREAPFNLSPPPCGHCPNSNYTPPPHSNGHSGALFFRRDFTIFFYHFRYFLPFFL